MTEMCCEKCLHWMAHKNNESLCTDMGTCMLLPANKEQKMSTDWCVFFRGNYVPPVSSER